MAFPLKKNIIYWLQHSAKAQQVITQISEIKGKVTELSCRCTSWPL